MIKTFKSLSKSSSIFAPSLSAKFGGPAKAYDWRDDPTKNNDIFVDPRTEGWDTSKFTFPFECEEEPWRYSIPADFDNSNVNQNFRPENKRADYVASMPIPYWNEAAEVNHEADYESEDADFQAEDFKMQHFRKKGPIWAWVLAANFWFVYIWADFFLQKFPDEDHWRVAQLPPLDHPNPEDTEDTSIFQGYQTNDIKTLVDAGIIRGPYFTIKDGQKYALPGSGGNGPMYVW